MTRLSYFGKCRQLNNFQSKISISQAYGLGGLNNALYSHWTLVDLNKKNVYG